MRYKIIFTFVVLILSTRTIYAQTFSDLQEIPRDSVNAEKMKIWIPVKNPFCNVKVKIIDNQNNPVRELLDRKLSKGYYNIFWDKKDDSGKFVLPGDYKAVVIACEYKKILPIEASYRNGENAAYFTIDDYNDRPSLDVQFLQDSVTTSLNIVNKKDILIEKIFKDSVLFAGEHRISWQPGKQISSGNYYFKLTLSGYDHWIPFRYKK